MEGAAAKEVKSKPRRRRKKPAQKDAGALAEGTHDATSRSDAAGQSSQTSHLAKPPSTSSQVQAGSASDLVATMMSDLRQAASAGNAKRSSQRPRPAPAPAPVPSRSEPEPSMNVAAPAFVPADDKQAPSKKTRRSAKKKRPASAQQPNPTDNSDRTSELGNKATAALEVLSGKSLGQTQAGGRGTGGGRSGGRRGRGRTRHPDRWWCKLEDIDPISMEPLSELRYPPLQLPVDEGGSVQQWFDGRILASYLVSTGRFAHPSSRRELGPDECDKIDKYLLDNSTCPLSAAAAALSACGRSHTFILAQLFWCTMQILVSLK